MRSALMLYASDVVDEGFSGLDWIRHAIRAD